MFKKVISTVLTSVMLMMLFPFSANAGDITSARLEVDGSTTFTTHDPVEYDLDVIFTLNEDRYVSIGVQDTTAAYNPEFFVNKELASSGVETTKSWNGRIGNVLTGDLYEDGSYYIVMQAFENEGDTTPTVGAVIGAFELSKSHTVSLDSSATTFIPADGDTIDFTITTTNNGYIKLDVYDTSKGHGDVALMKTYTTAALPYGTYTVSDITGFSWDGTDYHDGSLVDAGDTYWAFASLYQAAPTGQLADDEASIANLTVTDPVASGLEIDSFTVVPSDGDSKFDPSSNGADETLEINYTLNTEANVTVDIFNPNNTQYKSFPGISVKTGDEDWDGVYQTKLVEPGIYTAKITVSKTGETTVTETLAFQVAYDSADKPTISNLDADPTTFDQDSEETDITFKNNEDCYLTVEIRNTNGDIRRQFSDYDYDQFNADDDSHSIIWDGEDDNGSKMPDGTYKAYVVARSEYGVVVETIAITLDDTGSSIDASNAHIKDISFSPSTFEPAEDDEVIIKFDIRTDLDKLEIFAIRGSEEIELFNEDNIDEENNVEISWEGTDDDDEYADEGTWQILFKSELEGTNLEAAKNLSVQYDKPEIDELLLSKTEFDPDLDEFTYILFQVDQDAEVTIEILVDNDVDDTIEEEMEVEKGKWYAIEWDGDGYDEDDDLDIKLTAANTVNEDIYDTAKISVDINEDEVSSSKSNVTNDYVSSVITGQSEDKTVYYELEDDADVTVTIYKGKSASGTKVIELIDINDQDSGDHEIDWNGLDDDGDKLSKGIYSYKIVSDKSSTDTEKGVFIIGSGEVDGDSSNDDDDDSSSSDDKISDNVTVNGEDYETADSGFCAGFSDVDDNSIYCDAIEWNKEEGIIVGYSDGTFKPYQPINRVELLKIILEAMGISVSGFTGSNLGFTDVSVFEWYMPYIESAFNIGVFHGDAGKNTARPGDYINRAEALKFVYEALRIATGYSVTTCGSSYSDVASGAWYAKYACAACC